MHATESNVAASVRPDTGIPSSHRLMFASLLGRGHVIGLKMLAFWFVCRWSKVWFNVGSYTRKVYLIFDEEGNSLKHTPADSKNTTSNCAPRSVAAVGRMKKRVHGWAGNRYGTMHTCSSPLRLHHRTQHSWAFRRQQSQLQRLGWTSCAPSGRGQPRACQRTSPQCCPRPPERHCDQGVVTVGWCSCLELPEPAGRDVHWVCTSSRALEAWMHASWLGQAKAPSFVHIT